MQFIWNDAVSLARSLVCLFKNERHYEDDLEFENDKISNTGRNWKSTDDYAFNSDDEETTSPTSPEVPLHYEINQV